jgi:hypothetical protein
MNFTHKNSTETRWVQVLNFLYISVPHLSQSQSGLFRQSLNHTSRSASPVASCYWLIDGCPAAVGVFYHCGKVRVLVYVVRTVFFNLENQQHLTSWAEFCGTPRQSCLKRIKKGLSRENRNERNPYASHNVGKDLSVGFVMGAVVYWWWWFRCHTYWGRAFCSRSARFAVPTWLVWHLHDRCIYAMGKPGGVWINTRCTLHHALILTITAPPHLLLLNRTALPLL